MTALFGGAQYFPFVDVGGFSAHRRQPRRHDDAQHLLVPADLHPHRGQPRRAGGYDLRLYKESGANLGRAGGDYIFRGRLHAAAGQLDRSCSARPYAGFLLGQPTGGSDRPQRRSAELHDVPRRVRPGRLEGLEPADRQPRAPLRATKARRRNPRTATCAASIRRRPSASRPRRRRPTRPTRFRSCRRRRSTRAAGCSSPSDSHPGFWNADKNNWQPRVGFAYQLNDKTVAPRRLRRLHGAVRHQRRRAARLLAGHAARRVGRPRADVQGEPGQSVPRRRARPPRARPLGPNTFLGQNDRPVRADRLQERRRTPATSSPSSASCRASGCSRSATSAARAGTSRPTWT